jgi:hypothetical protein
MKIGVDQIMTDQLITELLELPESTMLSTRSYNVIRHKLMEARRPADHGRGALLLLGILAKGKAYVHLNNCGKVSAAEIAKWATAILARREAELESGNNGIFGCI